jgi:thiosulfate/3-mercaptopyruvate sulfurtransferase
MVSDHLVSTDWLADRLSAPDIAVLDATWHLPTLARNARQEYVDSRIPGARFFDIDDISDKSSPYPHMLPSPEQFSSRMRKMGIGDGKKVVVYDTYGIYSAARAWWMFRVFGKEDVAVLDGGFKKWMAEGRPVESGEPPHPQERHFTSRFQSMMVRDRGEVAEIASRGAVQLADARSPGRFAGTEPEPRAGVRSGHVPGARNVPFGQLVNPDGTLKPPKELAGIFQRNGIDPGRPTVSYCGSGVTAAIVALALATIGNHDNPVYDGSWAEWGSIQDLPLKTGTEP